ncbi:Bacterial transcription activator, effector binding domain [Stieleria maiorica]|uniref:Bacterial transcription activator, effector binding domain n=1 Tax=Stieleria maiorica TaxID=2795974 RepID=A0A5B9MIX9_9BACT|nr:GyrI-like domain-containing protein [Stieleria maiorica]QEG01323.1 Bacterial transcription activator, effector binding domain [Stieleria maiorica]
MKIETHPVRMLYGIETRVSGECDDQISALWERFHSEGLIDDMPERVDDFLIAAYLEYEGDRSGARTYFLGCEVFDACCPEEGFAIREIPAGTYAVFQSRGDQPGSLAETWQQIRSGNLRRNFLADFEIHDPADPSSVAIYIGLTDQCVTAHD